MRAGVLALQGDFREHAVALESGGADVVLVRKPEELASLDALVIPGGESTTIGKLADRYDLIEPLRNLVKSGVPTLGTCAGMIFLAAATTGDAPQIQLGMLDIVVQRNAFGRQVASFESELEVEGIEGPVHAVFIRAPWIDKVGEGVEVLATVDDHPVMVREGNILATSFHPELTDDARIHRLLLELGDG